LRNASKDMEARSHPLTPDRNKRASDPGEIGRREASSRPIGKMLQRRRAGVEKAAGSATCWLLTDVALNTHRGSGGREPILGRSARRPQGRPAHAIPGGLFIIEAIAE
jgi:hypothetical protein